MATLDTPQLPEKSGRLIFVQYLRGCAAMMVVFHHALHHRPGIYNPLQRDIDLGRPGVLIFFVISGFIMMHACRNEPPLTFIQRRIIRVVPLYWLMTFAFFAIIFPNDFAAGNPTRRLDELIQSLFFIPHWHSGKPTEIWPILVPGWTLSYEMFFFGIFAIAITSGRPAHSAIFLLSMLLIAGWIFDYENPIWLTWTNNFLMLFIAGITLALVWKKTDFSAIAWILPAGALLILAAGIKLPPEEWIVPLYFVSAVMIVAGVLACQDRFPAFNAPILAIIGNASYSIYLSHTITMVPLYKVLRALPLHGWLQFIVVFVLSVTISTLIGIAIYKLIERPMIKGLGRVFDKSSSPKQGA
ncbi:MAG: acyltransferase [Sulfitobacter sp.]